MPARSAARPSITPAMRLLRQIPRFILIPLLVLAGAAIALAPVPVRSAPGFSLGAKLPQLGKGHIWCVALDPAQPSTMLAGTDAGVYTSGDGGVTWSLTLPGPRVWTAGFDARNPALAFAGTNGDGIYSSPDAGRTWQSARVAGRRSSEPAKAARPAEWISDRILPRIKREGPADRR